MIDGLAFSPDILEFIRQLAKHRVRYLVVGGEAVIYYGHARLTGDIDFFYDRSAKNVRRLYEALREFWEGEVPEIETFDKLTHKGLIIQYGLPPNRIDLINQIDGVEFEQAWPTRTTAWICDGERRTPVAYIGLEALVRNKEAAGRHKDLDDLKFLRRQLE